MHLTVGYLATPTGDDGVALAGSLAKTFDASVDVVLVVREELPDGHPGRIEYQRFLIHKGEEWIAQAISAPVLYHVQWDDEIFPRDGQFELFDALSSVDKRLTARSGRHAETEPGDEASWQEFIRRNTAGPHPASS